MEPVMIVTGGSQDIGEAVAGLAGARGYAGALTYQSNKTFADSVVAEIVAAGGRAIAVNVRAPFLMIREAVARMATDRGGTGGAIVNISSLAAELGGAGEWIHYAASKGALDSLTIGASKELAKRGISVNAVSPGLIETDLHARAGLPDRQTRLVGGVPMGRVGSPLEVANTVLWLLSPEASYITGVIVPVSGGR